VKIKHKIPESSGTFPQHTFLHRELSVLTFFERVLASARNDNIPLLERLRFLTICSSILDEFFEIRVGGLKERHRLGIDRVGPDGLSTADVLSQIRKRVLKLIKIQYRTLNRDVLPALAHQGIQIIKRSEWQKKHKDWAQNYFREQVAPVLTPVALDPAHPFPRLLNKSLNMLIALDGVDAYGRTCEYAILHVPRCLPRVIAVPVSYRYKSDNVEFVLLSSVIHSHVSEVFPGVEVTGCHQFRVTRHADLEVDEEEVEDLLDALKGELHGRRFGDSVRLEVAETCPNEHVDFLLERFALSQDDLYRVGGPVNLSRLATVVGMVDRHDLKYPVFVPGALASGEDMFERLQRRDILLHHPYESFSPVVDLLSQAANDPNVLAIKHTLYRTGNESPFVDALVEAARAGKEVTAVVELRARFDEAANIDIASRLQAAGAQVVYGIVGFKTHAKILMVVRREGERLRRYVHLGTGNYHTGTARLYTDFSLLTADADLAEQVHLVFQQLTGIGEAKRHKDLIQSPFYFASEIVDRLNREAEEARLGRPALAVIKINSLSDPSLIEAIYHASRAGVHIHLIVRGICCLTPQVSEVSDHIYVRSIVGRFLEHSRIYYFYAAGAEEVYLASADLMQRNLYRRVEVGFPVRDSELKERVIKEGLQIYLEAVDGAWFMDSDGHYSTHPKPCYDLAELSLMSKRLDSDQGEESDQETTKVIDLRPRLVVEDDFISAQSWLMSRLVSQGS
jgi:polyphosphate kinase